MRPEAVIYCQRCKMHVDATLERRPLGVAGEVGEQVVCRCGRCGHVQSRMVG